MKWRSAFIQKDIIRDGNKNPRSISSISIEILRESELNFVVDQSRDFS